MPSAVPALSPFQAHVRKWENCVRCPLHEGRSRVCHVRGRLPCQVMFVGEAPGTSEDATGVPFVGPAGHLLDQIIKEALPAGVTYSLTNLVGCLPLDDGKKAGAPDDKEIKACSPRLLELVALAKPRLIVLVGKLPADWLAGRMLKGIKLPGPEIPMAEIVHPAALLRMNQAQSGLAYQRCVVVVRNAAEGLAP